MREKLSFNKRLTIYLLLVFVIFSFLIILMQFNREKEFRKRQLENTLDNITEMTNNYVVTKEIFKNDEFQIIDSLINILPQSNIRITLIDNRGTVKYDSEVEMVDEMENHLKRPELQLSIRNQFGSNIRSSNTTGKEYFYYSKFYDNYYVRTAALYDVNVKDFLKAEKLFIFYLILLCIIIGFILQFMTLRFSRTIVNLKDFAMSISRGENVDVVNFPSDELGIISAEIVNIYNQLNKAKDSLDVEKNKLFNHLHALNEGVAFFSHQKEKLFTNNHFIHYLNHISEKSTISAEDIFMVKEFKPILKFIENQIVEEKEIQANNLPQFEMKIAKNNKYFEVKCIFFEDRNFEIVIQDVSKLEKRKLMKQQMTSNISHELKTPAATILGYLETLKENKLDEKQKKHFTNKAFDQARKLSDLLDDLSTLNNIEETSNQFLFEKINLVEIIKDVEDNLQLKLEENNIKSKLVLPDKLIVIGNSSLLFSIFYNLYENAIKYGGEGIKIVVNNFMDENDFLHFSFANTGNEIDDEHLTRIFERFYRVDSGRSRKTGGTGLGLAIVKNAVQLHGGKITARNYNDGGLEFLFTLYKG